MTVSTRAPTSAGLTPELPILRIVQFFPSRWNGSSNCHWNPLRNGPIGLFITLQSLGWSLFSSTTEEYRIGFRGFQIPDVSTSIIPMCSFVSLAPPGYALVHVTTLHKTAALYSFSSGFLDSKSRCAPISVSPLG
jgi:hypothetical protein